MAGRIALDLKMFKHLSSDGNCTTLLHKDGHKLVVAHKALSPDMQAQLSKLPKNNEEEKETKMAEGGDLEPQHFYDSTAPVQPKPTPKPPPMPSDEDAKKLANGMNGGYNFAEGGKTPRKGIVAPTAIEGMQEAERRDKRSLNLMAKLLM
jgi:hypothetical protein